MTKQYVIMWPSTSGSKQHLGQGMDVFCHPSPLFNIFLERIMSGDLEEHDRKVSIGDKNIRNQRFADDIDALVHLSF